MQYKGDITWQHNILHTYIFEAIRC